MNEVRDDQECCCTSFKNLGLTAGTEVRIIKGVKLEAKPERVIVIREYKTKVLLDMEFVKSLFCRGLPPRHVRICITKGSMLCGDVELQRKKDGVTLCGDEVGRYEWI